MKSRDFWNLAGRAGRLQHDSVGVVGIAAGKTPREVKEYVSRATGELVSQMVKLLDELEKAGKLNQLTTVINNEQWVDFRCYVAHLWNEKKDLNAVLAETEGLLRNTYGYGSLRSVPGGEAKAKALLDATKAYARELARHPENAKFADSTGFSPEGARSALLDLSKLRLEKKLSTLDWMPESLFGAGPGGQLSDLFGIMLKVPQIRDQLSDISGKGDDHKNIAEITTAWISGDSIQQIAKRFFKGDLTKSITDACRAIYRNLINNGAWGLSALSKMPTSGIDFDSLSESELRRINVLPAMLYHGVGTEEAVLMRMNSAPRSIAEQLGHRFRMDTGSKSESLTIGKAREFLKSLQSNDWEQLKPTASALSGYDYKTVWGLLSGEDR